MEATLRISPACIQDTKGRVLRDPEGWCYHQRQHTQRVVGDILRVDTDVVAMTDAVPGRYECDTVCDLCQTVLPRHPDGSGRITLNRGACHACKRCADVYEQLTSGWESFTCTLCDDTRPIFKSLAPDPASRWYTLLCRDCLAKDVPEAHKQAVSKL